MSRNEPGAGSPPPLALGEAARLAGAELVGDPERRVTGLAPLAGAGPDELGLLADRRYLEQVPDSEAGALLVSRNVADALDDPRPRLVVPDAHRALVPLLLRLHPPAEPDPGVHPTAVLGRGVSLGEEVTVGPWAVLEEGARLGDRARVGAHAFVGRGASVGADSVLHDHVTLYPGTRVGERVILHSGARIGSDGFGYAFADGGHRKVPQVGGCIVEDDVEIGANSCVDRGSIGDTVIGRGTKMDNLVHVAHNVKIGPHSILTALVGIAGSTTVGSGVMFGGQSGAVGHVVIGDGCRIGAQAGVTSDLEPGTTVLGFPARDSREFMKGVAHLKRLPDLLKRVRALETGRSGGDSPGGGDEGP